MTKDHHLSKRLTELESTVAFLDDTVEQLNAIIAKQDAQLAEQQRLLAMLIKKSAKTHVENTATFDPAAEKPPHY